jgi:chemotaxis protein MotB
MREDHAALPIALLYVAMLLTACAAQSSYDALQRQNQQPEAQSQQLQVEIDADDPLFPPGGYQLSPAAKAELTNNIVPKLIGVQNAKIGVYGYTDNTPVGPQLQQAGINNNLSLSLRRALEVMNFLISQGINPNVIFAKGFGDTHPVASNDTPQSRAQNNRVDIVVSGPGAGEGGGGAGDVIHIVVHHDYKPPKQ